MAGAAAGQLPKTAADPSLTAVAAAANGSVAAAALDPTQYTDSTLPPRKQQLSHLELSFLIILCIFNIK